MSYNNSVSARVKLHKSDILYKRVGKRYVQCNDPHGYSGLREGHWYVKVTPGCTSIREAIWPNHTEVQAALFDLEEKLVELMRKATEAKHRKALLTPAEKKAWDHLIKVGGESFSTLSYGSLYSIAEEILRPVKDRLIERGSLPAPGAKKTTV